MPEKLTQKQGDAMDRLVRLIGDEVIGVANGPEQAIYGAVRRGIEAAIKEAEGGDNDHA